MREEKSWKSYQEAFDRRQRDLTLSMEKLSLITEYLNTKFRIQIGNFGFEVR